MKTMQFWFCFIFVFKNAFSSSDSGLPRNENSVTTQDVVEIHTMENQEQWNRLTEYLTSLHQICSLLNNHESNMISEATRIHKTDHDNKTVHGSEFYADNIDVINRASMPESALFWKMNLVDVNQGALLGAIEEVNRMDKMVHLNWWEKLEEGFRSFIGLDKSAYISHLLNEELANERIAREILKLMATYGIKHHIVASGIWEWQNRTHRIIREEPDNFIDMRKRIRINKLSRVLPHIETLDKNAYLFCRMDEPLPELSGWQKFSLFFENIFYRQQYVDDELFAIYDFKCENAFGISKSSDSSLTDTMLYSLHDGEDRVFAAELMKNILFLRNGRKTIYGGLRDDRFVCYGNKTTGLLYGSSGYNTLDMSNVQNDGALSFNYNQIMGNKSLHITGEYFDIMADNINEIVGRKNAVEVVQCHCGIHKLDLRGGSQKGYNRDTIVIPELKCHFDIIIELQGYTIINNIAKNGSFIYTIDGTKKSETYLFQANNVINTVKFKNVKLTDVNIVYESNFVTFTMPNSREAMLFKISAPTLESTIVHFANSSAIMWKNGHTIISLKSEKPILEIIEEYANFVDKLSNATLIATSTCDNERAIFSHNLVEIKHNNGSTKMVNVIHNGKGDATLHGRKDQENYFMIQAYHDEANSSANIQNFRIGNLTIRGLQETKKNYIDLHKLSKRLSNKNYELLVKAEKTEQSGPTNDINLNLYAIKSNSDARKIKAQLIGSIQIVDGAADAIYSTLDIFVYGQLHLKKKFNNLALEVDPINLDNKDILVLHCEQFERGTEFIFNKNITSMDLFEISDKHLILSYMPNYISYTGLDNLLTIIFVDYFINTEKFQSVTLNFNQDVILSVQELLSNVLEVAPIASLWRSIDEKLVKNNPRGTEYKIQ